MLPRGAAGGGQTGVPPSSSHGYLVILARDSEHVPLRSGARRPRERDGGHPAARIAPNPPEPLRPRPPLDRHHVESPPGGHDPPEAAACSEDELVPIGRAPHPQRN